MKFKIALIWLMFCIPIFAQDWTALNISHETSFVVFPQDCNANPPMLFGGKILAEMDRCAGITARRFLYASPFKVRDAVTVAINNVKFNASGEVKDLIFVRSLITKIGEKSITIKVVVERETPKVMVDEPTNVKPDRQLLVEGEFVFCSYDLVHKKAVPHGIISK